MLHDERPIHLDELADVTKKLYRALDKLDSKLLSIKGMAHVSIFMESSPLYNRKAIDFAYTITRRYANYEATKNLKLVLYNYDIEQIINN